MKIKNLIDALNPLEVYKEVKKFSHSHSGVVAGIGVVATAAGTVLCCRATLKADKKSENHIKIVESGKKEAKNGNNKALVKAYGTVARDYFRIYIAGVATWSIGIALLLKSRGIEVAKNKELASAYLALDAAFKNYRAKVKEQIGAEEEKKIYDETVTNNKNLYCDKRFTGVDGSIFVFDESSFEFEPKQPRSNAITLISVAATLNSRLNRKKVVYLNDLMREVGHKELVNGWDWCWIKTGPGEKQIDFSLDDRSLNQDFINGINPVAKLRLTGLKHVSCAFAEGIYATEGLSGEIGCGPCIIE